MAADEPGAGAEGQGTSTDFTPTQEQRDLVAVNAGAGVDHEEIALGLGITRELLDKHFAYELSNGAYARRLKVVESIYRAATGEKPNASAGRAYLEMEPGLAVPPDGAPKPPKQAPAVPLGKKEKAELDSHTAHHGSDWGPLLTPTKTQH